MTEYRLLIHLISYW